MIQKIIDNRYSNEFRTRIGLPERNTSPEILATLAQDEEWEVRYRVAKNPNTTLETLALLAKDEEWIVRGFTVTNSNIIFDCLIELLQDENLDVRKTALRHPRVPDEYKMLIFMNI